MVTVGCVGNAYAYEQRTRVLKQQWNDAEAAGVPPAKIDPLRVRLKGTELGRGGTLPYATTSMAMVQDPVADLERQTRRLYEQVTADSRSQAQEALTKLGQEYGPTPFDRARYEQQLLAARKPVDFQKLARSWSDEGQQLSQIKEQLGAQASGLSNGLPVDVVSQRDQLQQTVDQLRQAQLWTDPADQTLNAVQLYLGGSYQGMLAQHEDLKNRLQAANDRLALRLEVRNKGNDLAGTIPGLLRYGQGSDYPSRADQAKQALLNAKDDDQLQVAVTNLQRIVDDLWQKKQEALQRLAAGSGGCESNPTGKLILLSLSQQRLVACDGNSTAYSAPVTSGRPGMETPTGTFTISYKQSPFLMQPDASCKQGDPCWYKATDVNYVMLFKGGGYFIHDWPPQEGAAFGPGTQAGRFGSHGCVHVPVGVLAQLYNWAPIGTTTIITA